MLRCPPPVPPPMQAPIPRPISRLLPPPPPNPLGNGPGSGQPDVREGTRVEEFWARARNPTQHKGRAVKKVETLFDEWKRLKKNENRTSATQTGNEDAFKKRLENIFDIAQGDAMSLITIPEDRAFLLAQREPGRRDRMTEADMALHSQEKKKRRRDDAEERRRSKASRRRRRGRQPTKWSWKA